MTATEWPPPASGRGPGGCPIVNVDIGLSGADPLPFRGVGRAARAVSGVLDRAVRRALGGHTLRRHPPRAAGAGDLLQRVDDRQRPDPEYTFIPTFLDPPEHGKYRTALQRPLLPGHGHAGHAGGPRGRQPLHRHVHRRRWLRVHDAFADPFPADVFLNAVNLPAADTPKFVRWVHTVFGRAQRPGAGVRSRRPGRVHEYF